MDFNEINKKRKERKITFWIAIFGIIASLLAIFVFKNKLTLVKPETKNYLAQIMSVETDLLQAWQRRKGLRTTLTYGDTGKEVVLLQRMLSQDPNIYPEQKITGYYGNLTQRAVRRFQEEYNLPQTGTVDTATKNKLNEIFLSFLCPEPMVIYPDLYLKKITKNGEKLPNDYIPPQLENISSKVRTIGTVCLRKDVVPYLVKMFEDAQKDGIYLAVTSGYRNPKIQKWIYDFWFSVHGSAAFNEIAEPGRSEHQLGTTVDLTDASIGYAVVDNRFARSDGGRWLAKNAYKYGFILSDPKGKERISGYKYEPWHWRFVGIGLADFLHNTGFTLNESPLNIRQKPYPRPDLKKGLEVSALALYSVFVDSDGREHVLIEKNKDTKLPIASITKLMVALTASDIYKTKDIVVITKNALQSKGTSGNYSVNDALFFLDALHALLISSHNEIAQALADKIGADVFLRLMNEKTVALGLANTHYFNPIGTDPEPGSENINYSSAFDVYKLLKYIFESRPDIFSILQKDRYQLKDIYNIPKVFLRNTNDLLGDSVTALPVLGGKTGSTPKAKLNLAIVSKAPVPGYIISVIIGSQDHFGDMKKLLKYVKDSFKW